MTAPRRPVREGVSLILCSRDRPSMLRDTVASILDSDELPTEIVVIDQSEHPDPTLEELAADHPTDLRYLHSGSVGLSRACNEGVAAARHDVLVFTHDDVVVTSSWLSALVSTLEEEGARAVVTGRVLPAEPETDGGFVPSTRTSDVPVVAKGRVGSGVLYPMSMAMRRSALREVGPFDERLGPGTPFPAAEDNDLAQRLLEAGYRIRYEPSAVLHHRAWRSRRDYLPLRLAYGKGQGAFYAKHASLDDPFVLRCAAHDLGQRIVRFVRRWREPYGAVGELAYAAGLLVGCVGWWIARGGRG